VLLAVAPHVVLDGALLAAEAIGARQVVIAVKDSAWRAHEALARAVAERRDAGHVRVQRLPTAYLAGEETALLHSLNGGPPKPTRVPPRPYERGLARRPTLVGNVETLGHVALIARHGPDWFRRMGTAEHPGSALITLSGAVRDPGVHEIALGTPLERVIGDTTNVRALLVGGYSGTWLPPAALTATSLDDAALAAHGAALGAGAIVCLSADACPVAEVARVARWMADQTAGQCGPCVHGLDAIAAALQPLAAGTARHDVVARLARWSGQVHGRGACHHPNGVARFVRSALAVFADELEDHRRHGPCDACSHRPVLIVPHATTRLAA
jgi:NADH:ubiquinone oxidoreductase subunit F (NADH-binding)